MRAAAPEAYPEARPSGRLEFLSWFFMRVSGVALLVLAVFHLVLMHHLIGVENLNFAVVAERWASPWWRLYDFFLLFLALIHGANGARVVIGDYVRRPGWRLVAQTLLAVITAVLLVLGTWIIGTFQAVSA